MSPIRPSTPLDQQDPKSQPAKVSSIQPATTELAFAVADLAARSPSRARATCWTSGETAKRSRGTGGRRHRGIAPCWRVQ